MKPGYSREVKINPPATNTETPEALSPQSVLVERVILVVFALLTSLVLIDAALEVFCSLALTVGSLVPSS